MCKLATIQAFFLKIFFKFSFFFPFLVPFSLVVEEGRGRLKITLVEVIKKDMPIKGVIESMTLERVEWRKIIHMAAPN